MRVAITGGRGFIGAQLVARLVALGAEVRVLGRQKLPQIAAAVRFVEGDLTDPATDLGRFVDGADVLYHCAAEISDDKRMYLVNVLGTERLIAAARGRIGRWVQLSSVGAYGPVKEGLVTEGYPDAPRGAYELTKARADSLVRVAAEEQAFAAVIIRPSNVFGSTMRNRSLFQLIQAVDRGLFFFIGHRGASANYVHVDNVVDALLRCATAPQADGRIYIVSDYRSLEEFIGIISGLLGRSTPRIRVPSWMAFGVAFAGGWFPGSPLTLNRVRALTSSAVYSTHRIEAELGYRTLVRMEEGLRQMVRAIQEKPTYVE